MTVYNIDPLNFCLRVGAGLVGWGISSIALLYYCRRRVQHIRQRIIAGASGEEELSEWQGWVWTLVHIWSGNLAMVLRDKGFCRPGN